jgi:hypothetical protein
VVDREELAANLRENLVQLRGFLPLSILCRTLSAVLDHEEGASEGPEAVSALHGAYLAVRNRNPDAPSSVLG